VSTKGRGERVERSKAVIVPAVAYCRLLSSSDTMPSNAIVSKALDAQAGRRQTCRRRDTFEMARVSLMNRFEQVPLSDRFLSNHDSAG
jgi:hypothetical protein